jgi:hypothetical protein
MGNSRRAYKTLYMETLKISDLLEDLEVDVKIILKLI